MQVHAASATLRIGGEAHPVAFEEHHDHGAGAAAHRDNNMRAAVVHVIADAAVSVLVIVGLILARTFDWMWRDPLAGINGTFVIASWAYGLIRDTGAIMLDMNPEPKLEEKLRRTIEGDGERFADLNLWRLGPGHLGAIVSVVTSKAMEAAHYRRMLASFGSLPHVTVEVIREA